MKLPHHLLFIVVFIAIMTGGCTQPFTQGKALYEANCSRCHGMDGKGFEDLYPGILQSPYLTDHNDQLACVIAYGSTYLVRQKNAVSDVPMPENQQLSAVEVLNIMNYLSWEYGEGQQRKIDEVMQTLENCLD